MIGRRIANACTAHLSSWIPPALRSWVGEWVWIMAELMWIFVIMSLSGYFGWRSLFEFLRDVNAVDECLGLGLGVLVGFEFGEGYGLAVAIIIVAMIDDADIAAPAVQAAPSDEFIQSVRPL